MTTEMKRSTLADTNRGICGSRNNCRYTGQTVCWEIWIDDVFWGAVNRKRTAVAIVEWARDNYDGVGDLFMRYSGATGDIDYTEVG